MASCPGTMWWLFLWGALQVCPTWSRVLLARRLPQTLMPPRYPEPYLKGQECAADIRAPEGLAVKLVFQDFDLEPSPHCERDSVTITASETTLGRFCGQQGPPLGSAPGQREFVSLDGRLQLTFHTGASSEDRASTLHKGFLALYQAVALNNSQPMSQASGGSEAISAPAGSPSEAHCQEPYYQAVPAGTLTCAAPGTWKDAQGRVEVPQCVPGPRLPGEESKRGCVPGPHARGGDDQAGKPPCAPRGRAPRLPPARARRLRRGHRPAGAGKERAPGRPPPPGVSAQQRDPVPPRHVGLRQRVRRGERPVRARAEILQAAGSAEESLRGLAPRAREDRGVFREYVLCGGDDAAAGRLPGGQWWRLRGVGRPGASLGGHGHRLLGHRVWQGV
ncbi:complement C1r subcomponent-like protein isoform X3 [Dasypus novemcinctus]|uniref:complement C1r subcomponent-like protein isoform X3 n=1 Tax=Dasypus novemcinctus TaxID=9361 RepID=UPI00032929CA|nr:complement C1r subcomponent-like protein isoform X3 [Dasypus novemcinctus]